jgi:adenylate kinase family enzyme
VEEAHAATVSAWLAVRTIARVRRVVIVGNSGSGKTTLAAALAARLGVPHVELDGLYHQAGWEPLPVPEFRAAVRAALDAGDAGAGGWVVCGNYAPVRSSIWSRADTIVWLDMPRAVVMGRVVGRSLTRVVRRVELWNGNREEPRMLLALHDPERSVIRWAWDGVEKYRTLYTPMMASTTWADVRWRRLRSPGEVGWWLAGGGPVPRSAQLGVAGCRRHGSERGPI